MKMKKIDLDRVAAIAAACFSIGLNPMPRIRRLWPAIKFAGKAAQVGDYRLDCFVRGRIENAGEVVIPGEISVEIRPMVRAADGALYGAIEKETRGNGGPFPLFE